MTGSKITLTAEVIAAAEKVLSKDQRVELIPTKTGIKLFAVQRKEVK